MHFLPNTHNEGSYFLLVEVKDLVEIRDSGHMSKVYAKNYSGKYILARKGVLLSGYTQPRAVRFAMIIPQAPERRS